MSYDSELSQYTVLARWKLEDADSSNGATCADEVGSNNLTYSTPGADLSDATPVTLLGAGAGKVTTDSNERFITGSAATGSLPMSLGRTYVYAFKPTNISGDRYFFSQYDDSSNYHFFQIKSTGTIDCRSRIGNSNKGRITTGTPITEGTEHLVAVVFPASGAVAAIYVDGVSEAVSSTGTIGGTAGIRIGGYTSANFSPDAEFYDVAVLGDELTADQIGDLYTASQSAGNQWKHRRHQQRASRLWPRRSRRVRAPRIRT